MAGVSVNERSRLGCDWKWRSCRRVLNRKLNLFLNLPETESIKITMKIKSKNESLPATSTGTPDVWGSVGEGLTLGFIPLIKVCRAGCRTTNE